MHKRQSAGDGASTLALKRIGGVNQTPKQRVPVAPQNGDLVIAIFFKKISPKPLFSKLFTVLKYLHPWKIVSQLTTADFYF